MRLQRQVLMVLLAAAGAACDARLAAERPAPATAPGADLSTRAAAPAAQGATVTQALPSGAERSPPPAVPPLQHQGVRYQQDLSGQEPAGSAPGGTLAAFDVASGQRLWLLQVYTVRDDPGAPMRHPGIYFRSLALVPDSGELEIENEVGGLYRVDLAKRQARQVGGPPERAAPSTPGKPKPSP